MVDKWIGKTAVITGASAGIGAAIFKEFARKGINVIGLARRSERVESLITELGNTKGKAFAYKCDVSNPESVNEAFKWIENKFGVVNILINNAGIWRRTSILDESEESFKKLNEILDTNVRGLTHCAREAFKLMKKSDDYSLIVNVNSVFGHAIPFIGSSTNMSAPSKYAVTAITQTIRHELIIADNKKVRITSLSPGFVVTEVMEASGYNASEVSTAYKTMPALNVEDIVHSVMFLLSTDYHVNVSELTIRPVGEKF